MANVGPLDLHGHERRILHFLERYYLAHGISPSFEEIRQAVNLPSKDHVFRDLNMLEEKGFIERQPGKSRSIRLLRCADGQPFDVGGFEVQVWGVIAAGKPIPAPGDGAGHDVQDTVRLTRDIVQKRDGVYALRVQGNSMIDALVNDGDIVILRHQQDANNGDMVAVWLEQEGETTLKRFYHEGSRIRLQPENQSMSPIYADPRNVRIQGKVIAVIRQLAA
ncbi:MAG: transcriptional repressor LexA [Chloroflexi bacterium]|nr:MAG: transcriptional repressor LexA [Chloroflexota bacterium]